ncbi:hypothetical protein [uncultured Amphritea sp.]|uniref:hypothetical protein n=1 Tax=uncultured Amphritea sp. TaxID=981605 RepID=UPI00260F1400|nr:hypothetical protein [uncultured Amphritea sp.]
MNRLFRLEPLAWLKMLIVCFSIHLINPATAAGLLPEQAQTDLEQQWGIRILSLRQSAAGYMLDFRYTVTDAAKAKPILDRSVKPQLIVTRTGNHLQVPAPPKLGPLRQSSRAPRTDTNYFIFFANPGRIVKPGDEVSIQIGKLEISGLRVSTS